jgi:hypothetical protein
MSSVSTALRPCSPRRLRTAGNACSLATPLPPTDPVAGLTDMLGIVERFLAERLDHTLCEQLRPLSEGLCRHRLPRGSATRAGYASGGCSRRTPGDGFLFGVQSAGGGAARTGPAPDGTGRPHGAAHPSRGRSAAAPKTRTARSVEPLLSAGRLPKASRPVATRCLVV